jgi:hypothetical protein
MTIFPLLPNTKEPATPNGCYDATRDLEQIEKWWDRNPDYNIGVAAGNGLVVVDLDVKHGVNGVTAYKELCPKNANPPYTVSTPTGGQHLYYFSLDEAIGNSASRVAPGVDVRTLGGYVVGAGSMLEGESYQVAEEGNFEPLPQAIAVRAKKTMERMENADEWLCEPDLDRNINRATAFLKATKPAIEGDGGNHWTFATAALVRDFGISQTKALDLISEHWNPRCEPPWLPEELAQVVANAYRYANRPAGYNAAEETLMALRKLGAAFRKTSRFSPLSYRDIQNMPPPVYLIDQVLTEEGIGFLYGPPGSRKSFVALDMCCSIATGRPWGEQSVQAGQTVYCTNEGTAGIGARVKAWAEVNGEPQDFRFVPDLPLLTSDIELKDLIDALDEGGITNPKLLVIDTLARATAGADENSAQDMSSALKGLTMLQKRLNCTILVVHHSGKDQTKGMRGSTAMWGFADTVLRVDAEDEFTTVSIDKQKEGPADLKPWGFRAAPAADSITLHLVPSFEHTDYNRTAVKAAFKAMVEAEEDNFFDEKRTVHQVANQIAQQMSSQPEIQKVVETSTQRWLNKTISDGLSPIVNQVVWFRDDTPGNRRRAHILWKQKEIYDGNRTDG